MPEPHGCDFLVHQASGIEVFKVLYSADPVKDESWEKRARADYASEALWQQEQLCNFRAFAGQLVFPEFQRSATVVEPYPIPRDVTWWMGIDPHPRVPHAFLWMFIDRFDNHVYCREYWPSRIYGRRGNLPEDDDLYQIDDYVATIGFLEGPQPNLFAENGYTDNQGKEQKVFQRIMDPAGKAFAASVEKGKQGTETFWSRYADLGINCNEAKKDFQAGRDCVGQRLRPKKYMGPEGESVRSQIRIFSTCKELIFELETNRYPVLTPDQAARRDPIETALPHRKHLTDLLRYIEIEEPYFVDPYYNPPRIERGVRVT